MAAAEDLPFGAPRQQYPPPPPPETESLLGQALQFTSTTRSDEAVAGQDDDDDEEEALSHSATSFTEKSTPTFATRKRSTETETTTNSNNGTAGNQTNSSRNTSYTPSKNNGETSTNGNATSSRMDHQDTFRSSTSTYVTDNREGHTSHVLSSLRPHDPLCLSHRSLQSEDSQSQLIHNGNQVMVIPQSVDTVPTSNVATFQAYQRHQTQNNAVAFHNKSTFHMDETEINSNRKALQNSPEKLPTTGVSPPQQLSMANSGATGGASNSIYLGNNTNNNDSGRRTVFGNRVRQRYPTATGSAHGTNTTVRLAPPPPMDPAPFYHIIENGSQITFQQAAPQPPDWDQPWSEVDPDHPTHRYPKDVTGNSNLQHQDTARQPPVSLVVAEYGSDEHHDVMDSAMTLDDFQSPRNPATTSITTTVDPSHMVSPLESPPLRRLPPQPMATTTSYSTNTTPTTATLLSKKEKTNSNYKSNNNHDGYKNENRRFSGGHKKHKRRIKIHETVHAQSLLLGLCFMAIWSPNNIMAPNLTQIATFYGMTENERDLYLGSFLALATGVLSFPLSAAIGILTDLYSRKILFVGTAWGGALASTATGLSPTYPCLLLARFFSGGFMSASVSVAFSLMGDLFAAEERNAASSGLTAMMGLGIILGQVYAGVVGSTRGWQSGFWVSSVVTAVLGLCVAIWVQEPVRGGKEKVLQDMIRQGKRYDRKLTWAGFINAMRNNQSNAILMAQGFFSSLPFGILFVFFNDYLSQERGFSVPDATFIVLVFGVGCAAGGILGGYLGAKIQAIQRPLLPVFMAATTLLGILPFFGLLNGHTTNAHGYWAIFYAFMGGCFASMPSVNVRPCLINVNPPETRGASLTAANLIINLARGLGPSCITILGSSFQMSRQVSFNVTLGVFWTVSAIQLCFLAKSLPEDQDRMEAELAQYAASALANTTKTPGYSLDGRSFTTADDFSLEPERPDSNMSLEDDVSLVSIEDRMTTFDNVAVRESISFLQKGMKELNFRPLCAGPHGGLGSFEEEEDSDPDEVEDHDEEEQRRREEEALVLRVPRAAGDDTMSRADLWKRRNMWIQQQKLIYGSTGGEKDENDDAHSVEGGNSDNVETPIESTRLV